ncbi:MAG: helix-turn-helix domain-containing protein [Lachnospiraceae bacterium]|nr:helix-turn-helix domain-containing protein [Lachnospiraceae bacterium]
MTFGEKLKEARKEAGVSQEQLADKMCVSRSAIAKWETDKGMPDVNNLKVMSQLLNVSVDYLLDDDEKLSLNEIREAINLEDYEKTGQCRDEKDAVCVAKNKSADRIYSLIRNKKMTKSEWIIDLIVQPGVVETLDRFKEQAGFYLVEKGTKQYLVKVTKDFIVTNELAERVDPKGFVIGDHKYKKGWQLV